MIRPEKIFFLPLLATVSKPFEMAWRGTALTTSRHVMPRGIFPVKRISTDSGISTGMNPKAAAKAIRPDPAGKLMPTGNRVWESPPVPTVSGSSIRLSQA